MRGPMSCSAGERHKASQIGKHIGQELRAMSEMSVPSLFLKSSANFSTNLSRSRQKTEFTIILASGELGTSCPFARFA